MALLNNTPQEYHDGNDHGNYQFVSLTDIINQFMLIYVGEDKIIPKAKRLDVAFHAQRALAELSFDTFKSCKAQEYEVPATLQMTLPQDYVNYTKISWVDSAGVKHLMYPASKTSNPSSNPLQDSDGLYQIKLKGRINDGSGLVNAHIQFVEGGAASADAGSKNILIGMRVTGQYIPDNTFVKKITYTEGVLSGEAMKVFLEDSLGNEIITLIDYPSGGAFGIQYTFSNADGSLILPQKSSFIVESLDWTITDRFITADTTASISDLEIGMLVYHDDIPLGTTITGLAAGTTQIFISNFPTEAVLTNAGQVLFVSPDKVDTTTWSNYKSATPSENQDDYQDDTYWPMDGSRYGLDPQHAQSNGSFYIDCITGKIHFSSNISGKTVILDYISDSLGTDAEMQVHKLAEEAMYKWISYAILSGKANVPGQIIQRLKRERFAETRKAKLRLSNIKLEELTQILRGKSKQIKH